MDIPLGQGSKDDTGNYREPVYPCVCHQAESDACHHNLSESE